ncbi:MAG: membrane protein insertase YidC [Planctomycetes bacterium]|nr:membrane protein insertase YidC [Planctomycetota bacterium]
MEFYEPKAKTFGWSQMAGLAGALLVLLLWGKYIGPRFAAPPPATGGAEAGGAVEEPGEEAAGRPEPAGGPVAGEEEPAGPGEEEGEEPEEGPAGGDGPEAGAEIEPAAVPDITFETEEFEVVLASRGGCLKSLRLRNYHFTPDDPASLPIVGTLKRTEQGEAENGFMLSLDEPNDFAYWNWKVESRATGESGTKVVMSAAKGGWKVTKEYVFPASGLVFTVNVRIENASGKARTGGYTMLTLPGILPDDVPNRFFIMQAVLAGRESDTADLMLSKINSAKASDMKADELRMSSIVNEWEGLTNRYFTAITAPDGPVTAMYVSPVAPTPEILVETPHYLIPNLALYVKGDLGNVAPDDTRELSYLVYAGPKSGQLLAEASVTEDGRDHDFDDIVVYGWGFFSKFDWLSAILVYVLNFFARLIPSYGIAITMLTLVVKVALHPMTRKSGVSMHKMQVLAPKIAEIKARYKADNSTEAMRRMNAETMELYRKHGVSPLGGCLPMLVQLPMFVALYGALRTAFELRQKGFLWIDDLTKPDELFNLPFTVPYFQWTTFNLLPILYMALIFIQQKLQPKSNDPQQQQQRKMMMLMPVMFFFIFYSMPSGLVLYFVVSNAMTLGEQWLIRRQLAGDPAILAMKEAAGIPAGESLDAGGDRETAWDRQKKRDERERQKRDERKKRRQNQ